MNRPFPVFLSCLCSLVSASFGNVVTPLEVTRTQDTFHRLGQAFVRYYAEYSNLPAGPFSAVMGALCGDNSNGLNPLKIVFFDFRAGRARSRFWRDDAILSDQGSDGIPLDGWGRRIILSVDSGTGRITLKSLGRNGRDDQGQADDMAFTYAPRQ